MSKVVTVWLDDATVQEEPTWMVSLDDTETSITLYIATSERDALDRARFIAARRNLPAVRMDEHGDTTPITWVSPLPRRGPQTQGERHANRQASVCGGRCDGPR